MVCNQRVEPFSLSHPMGEGGRRPGEGCFLFVVAAVPRWVHPCSSVVIFPVAWAEQISSGGRAQEKMQRLLDKGEKIPVTFLPKKAFAFTQRNVRNGSAGSRNRQRSVFVRATSARPVGSSRPKLRRKIVME
jgi:hypothetical protein